MFKKLWKISGRLLVAGLLSISLLGSCNTSEAYISDSAASIIGGMEKADPYQFLNNYGYKYESSKKMYYSKDKLVWATIDDYTGGFERILVIGPGYSTMSGITVGMDGNVPIHVYKTGIISEFDTTNRFEEEYGTGRWVSTNKKFLGGHKVHVYEYITPSNHLLSFMIDNKTDKIIAFEWIKRIHGNYDMIRGMDYHGFSY